MQQAIDEIVAQVLSATTKQELMDAELAARLNLKAMKTRIDKALDNDMDAAINFTKSTIAGNQVFELPKRGSAWLALCQCASTAWRAPEFRHTVQAHGGRIFCGDGKRAHVIFASDVPDGFYFLFQNRIVQAPTSNLFLDHKSLVLDFHSLGPLPEWTMINEDAPQWRAYSWGMKNGVLHSQDDKKPHYHVNKRYMDDALSFSCLRPEYGLLGIGAEKPALHLSWGDAQAFIMPLYYEVAL